MNQNHTLRDFLRVFQSCNWVKMLPMQTSSWICFRTVACANTFAKFLFLYQRCALGCPMRAVILVSWSRWGLYQVFRWTWKVCVLHQAVTTITANSPCWSSSQTTADGRLLWRSLLKVWHMHLFNISVVLLDWGVSCFSYNLKRATVWIQINAFQTSCSKPVWVWGNDWRKTVKM